MAAISLNGTNITGLGAPNVAIDTGTTLIGGPSAVVETFYESIGGAYALDQEYEGYYTYPCDTEVDIAFTFGNIVRVRALFRSSSRLTQINTCSSRPTQCPQTISILAYLTPLQISVSAHSST